MRKRIYEVIEVSKDGDKLSTAYDLFMLITIIVSIIPLGFKQTRPLFHYIDIFTAAIFIIDYVLRFITADHKLDNGALSFIRYPFTFWAVIDLVSILPSLTILNSSFKLLKLFRIFRTFRAFRVFRIFKALRYSKSLVIIVDVIKNSKDALLAVCTLAVGYILISALVIFNVEGDSFNNFFEAVYWGCITLVTVGYGDLYPVTTAGRIITMLSSFLGIAIVALPAGIITAGYMTALENNKKEGKQNEKE